MVYFFNMQTSTKKVVGTSVLAFILILAGTAVYFTQDSNKTGINPKLDLVVRKDFSKHNRNVLDTSSTTVDQVLATSTKVKDDTPSSSPVAKKQLIIDARQIASKYHLIHTSLFCVLSDIEEPGDLSEGKATITFREYHGKTDYETCRGDTATSPRLFSMEIDTATGKVFADANPEIQMEEVKLDEGENKAMTMTLPALKDKILFYFRELNESPNTPDKDIEDLASYYWVYVRRNPEDGRLSFLNDLAKDNFDHAWDRLGPCFGIPEGQCRE
jgi:hypothetical protein